jgi:CheY-like chemotaxis protein
MGMTGVGRACSILVIDDDDAIREALSALLEDEGYPVATAANGLDALTYLQSRPLPSLILLDLKMPVMNGRQFRAAQQQDAALAEIPVAVLSAHVTNEVRAEVDADAFLGKPFDIEMLLATISRLCVPPTGTRTPLN